MACGMLSNWTVEAVLEAVGDIRLGDLMTDGDETFAAVHEGVDTGMPVAVDATGYLASEGVRHPLPRVDGGKLRAAALAV